MRMFASPWALNFSDQARASTNTTIRGLTSGECCARGVCARVRRVRLAGRYMLTELSDLAYEIRAEEGMDRVAETLLVSRVVAYRRTGALVIEGHWP